MGSATDCNQEAKFGWSPDGGDFFHWTTGCVVIELDLSSL